MDNSALKNSAFYFNKPITVQADFYIKGKRLAVKLKKKIIHQATENSQALHPSIVSCVSNVGTTSACGFVLIRWDRLWQPEVDWGSRILMRGSVLRMKAK